LEKIVKKAIIIAVSELEEEAEERIHDFRLEVSLERIKNISLKTTSEISRLGTVLVGPLCTHACMLKEVIIESEWETFFDLIVPLRTRSRRHPKGLIGGVHK